MSAASQSQGFSLDEVIAFEEVVRIHLDKLKIRFLCGLKIYG